MFTFEKTPLTNVLKIAKLASHARAAHPAARAAKIEALPDGRVQVKATDFDNWLTYIVPNAVASPDSASVIFDMPAITKVVAATDRGALIRVDGDTISADDISVTLDTIDSDAYPDSPAKFDGAIHATIDAKALSDALASVGSAMSDEETRYYLRGIYVEHIDQCKMRFTATDGHRLMSENVDAFTDAPIDAAPIGHIIRDDTVKLLQACIDAGEPNDVISISYQSQDHGRILITGSGFQIATRDIDATYPSYRRVIPAPSNNVARVESKALKTACDKVKRLHKGAVAFDVEHGAVTATGDDIKAMSVKCEFRTVDSADTLPEIAFNLAYIAPMIAALGGDSVCIDAASAGDPTLWKPADSARDILGVLMPMRIQ